MSKHAVTKTISLGKINNKGLIEVCGHQQKNLKIIEDELDVKLTNLGNQIAINGSAQQMIRAESALLYLAGLKMNNEPITQQLTYQVLRNMTEKETTAKDTFQIVKTPLKSVKAKTKNQSDYLQSILDNDVTFGVGPAGTGKTYLAVAQAASALANESVKRIILVRPVVEAGENLGFLPGDIGQKVDPYLRPLYDALYEFFGNEKVDRLLENNTIELAPLAYMRGRTLSDAFVILDEAQNATENQMKMFLTRIGYGATAVVTGDLSQIDLPRGTQSGLRQSVRILDGLKGVSINNLTGQDIVRHPLVQRIVERYEKDEKK